MDWACNSNGERSLKTLKNEFGGRRPRNRWLDAVERDIKKLSRTENLEESGSEWRGLIQETKARHRAVAP
ncbi:hypothetical protein C0J52_20202 [Blattella germanica]|nr:hypothetical protein C0J52_20202 [Blattella germanica]